MWRPFVAKYRKAYQRDKSSVLLQKHPTYTARMRTILLDWLIEVCEVYRLHRETFYLSADFFDRYMTRKLDVPKTKLQLIGKFTLIGILIIRDNRYMYYVIYKWSLVFIFLKIIETSFTYFYFHEFQRFSY